MNQTMERIKPVWTCLCGFTTSDPLACRDHDDLANERTGETYHLAYPLPHENARVECAAGCDQTGCDLTDCLWHVQETGCCPECGEAGARIFIEASR